jgi:hypothetical protein
MLHDMLLADAEVPIAMVLSVDAITFAIIAFQFTCFVFPKTIKNRSQFFAAFYVTLFILVVSTVRLMLYKSPTPYVVLAVITGVSQIVAIILLFLSAGGMTIGQFAGELKGSYEVIRRGGEEKEVIVPIRGEQPLASADDDDVSPASNVHVIETPQKTERTGPVPLE